MISEVVEVPDNQVRLITLIYVCGARLRLSSLFYAAEVSFFPFNVYGEDDELTNFACL
jgi:hypothetical protein